MARQRRLSQAGLLEKQWRAQLAEIGFEWEQERWDEMYERLAAYERAHGDCLVPRCWPEDRALADCGARGQSLLLTLVEAEVVVPIHPSSARSFRVIFS